MGPVIPIPQQIAGCLVVAAITVPSRPGEPPHEFIVICQDQYAPARGSPYSTWRAGTADGRVWEAGHGRRDLTWPEAVASFASRASIPAHPDSADQAGNEAAR